MRVAIAASTINQTVNCIIGSLVTKYEVGLFLPRRHECKQPLPCVVCEYGNKDDVFRFAEYNLVMYYYSDACDYAFRELMGRIKGVIIVDSDYNSRDELICYSDQIFEFKDNAIDIVEKSAKDSHWIEPNREEILIRAKSFSLDTDGFIAEYNRVFMDYA